MSNSGLTYLVAISCGVLAFAAFIWFIAWPACPPGTPTARSPNASRQAFCRCTSWPRWFWSVRLAAGWSPITGIRSRP